jgi:hypothetical protein
MSDLQNCDLTREHLMKQPETQALGSSKPATKAGTNADLETSSSTVSGSSAKNAGSGTKSETPRTDAKAKDNRQCANNECVHADFARELELELNAAKAENALLTARMAKIKDELTAAWMCGFHKRDDEVARLTKERDEAKKSERETSDAYLRIRELVKAFDTNYAGENRFEVTENKVMELRAKLAEAENELSLVREVCGDRYPDTIALGIIHQLRAQLAELQGHVSVLIGRSSDVAEAFHQFVNSPYAGASPDKVYGAIADLRQAIDAARGGEK